MQYIYTLYFLDDKIDEGTVTADPGITESQVNDQETIEMFALGFVHDSIETGDVLGLSLMHKMIMKNRKSSIQKLFRLEFQK